MESYSICPFVYGLFKAPPPVKKDCILVFAHSPYICLVILMTVFAQRRQDDDKNLPNHWLWQWVEVTACFPSQRSTTFLSWNARVPSPALLPLGQRSGMVSNPEWASSASWCCGEDRLLSCKLRWRDSFDFFQLQRKGWAQWQQVVITFRRSCEKVISPRGHQRRRELLYHSFHLKKSQLSEGMIAFLVIAFLLSRITVVGNMWMI